MPSLYTITSGALASSADINQLVNTLTGNQNTPVSIKNTDPIAYTLQLQNTDAAGKTLLIYGPDGTTVILRSQSNGVVASPDGTAAAPIVTTTHPQTLANKTFTAPHLTAPVVDSGGLTVVGTTQLQGGTLIGSAAAPPASGLIIVGAPPAAGAAQLGLGYQIATTANAGTGGAPPAQITEYLVIGLNGVTRKIALFAV